MEKITVQTNINAPISKVWDAFTDPEAIMKWNAAAPDWHSPRAINDLRVGGEFNYRMEAKNGSEGFDFTGTYTVVQPQKLIEYAMEGGRQVSVRFGEAGEETKVTTMFDPENENPPEFQRQGWQSILDNFKQYVETV